MARSLIWSEAAQADIDDIEAHIAIGAPLEARRVVEKIREIASKQRDFPFSARMIPEFQDPSRRETFIYEYRLMYRVEPDRVRVLRVVHGRRLLKNVPGSFEEMAQEPYRAA